MSGWKKKLCWDLMRGQISHFMKIWTGWMHCFYLLSISCRTSPLSPTPPPPSSPCCTFSTCLSSSCDTLPRPSPSCLIISSTSSSRIPFIHLMTVSFTLPHLGSRSIKGWVRPSSTLSMISSFPWIRLHVQIGIHRDSAHCWICLAVFWGANLGSQELFFE